MAQSLRLACIVVHYAHRNKTLHLYLDLNRSKIHKIMIIVPKVCWHLGLVNLAKKIKNRSFLPSYGHLSKMKHSLRIH